MDPIHSEGITIAHVEPVLPPYNLSSAENKGLPSYSQDDLAPPAWERYESSYREVIDETIERTVSEHDKAKFANKTINHWSNDEHDEHNRSLGLAFYTAIANGDCEYVTRVTESGLRHVNAPNQSWLAGEVPLITAVKEHQREVARCLLHHGAAVDQPAATDIGRAQDKLGYRTPLQLAASLGDLPMVKMLIEEFHADPSIIAADGQHALRLAADGGHSHVVRYLPAIRGGAFRRIKVRCRKPLHKITEAATNVYKFAKTLVYELPRCLLIHCVYRPIRDLSMSIWKGMKALPSFLYRQAKLAPERFRRLCAWATEQIKKIPQRFVRFLKAIPRFCVSVKDLVCEIASELFRLMKAIARYAAEAAKTIGASLLNILHRIISLLHTTVTALLTLFRNLTLSNIYHGCADVLRAVFITFPRVVASSIKHFWFSICYYAEKYWDILGILLLGLMEGIWELARYIPAQLWKMITGAGQLMQGLGKEIRIWWNPKAGVDSSDMQY